MFDMLRWKSTLARFYWFFVSPCCLGIGPRHQIQALRYLPRFVRDWLKFRESYSGPLFWMPCLHDRDKEGGTAKGEYFWQDLLVARWIFAAKPVRHVDIGSSVEGFVAHVASFREIEVFDVRPISTQIPGVTFTQADLMCSANLPNASGEGGHCDSLSCLHALEHFGLGRYGDPLDALGHEKGIASMVTLLKPGGTFYLSTPIGQARVEFNAHRVFDPRTIIGLVEGHGLHLQCLTVIGTGGVSEVQAAPDVLLTLANAPYNLGIFVFTKP